MFFILNPAKVTMNGEAKKFIAFSALFISIFYGDDFSGI